MVVCVCNAIREKELREIAREGFPDPCSPYARVGRRPKCGQCLPFAPSIIAAAHAIDSRSRRTKWLISDPFQLNFLRNQFIPHPCLCWNEPMRGAEKVIALLKIALKNKLTSIHKT